MSDNERDDSRDDEISGALRSAVARQFRSDRDNLTLRSVRGAVEERLGLESGYLKSDAHWKDLSKEMVLEEIKILEANEEPEPSSLAAPPESKAEAPVKAAEKKKRKEKIESDAKGNDKGEEDEPKPRKRGRKPKAPASPALSKSLKSPKANKRKAPTKDAAAPGEGSKADDAPPPQKKGRKTGPKKKVVVEDDEEGDKDGDVDMKVETEGVPAVASGDESELSVLIDDPLPPPPPPKKGKGKAAAEPKEKKAKAGGRAKKEKAPAKELSPDEAQIKTLQGWLVKCGVRKLWHRELAKYDNSKDKIRHLKGMLTDVGMTGRYSQEKAKKIKADRELKAEVEAIQQTVDTRNDSDSEDDVGLRSRAPGAPATAGKRRARGLKTLAFLDDQSEDDSD